MILIRSTSSKCRRGTIQAGTQSLTIWYVYIGLINHLHHDEEH